MWLFILVAFLSWSISALMTLDAYTKATPGGYNFWTSTGQYFLKYPQYFMISMLTMIIVVVLAELDLLSYVLQNIFGLTDIMKYLPEETYNDLNYRFNVFAIIFLGFKVEDVVSWFRRRDQPLTKDASQTPTT